MWGFIETIAKYNQKEKSNYLPTLVRHARSRARASEMLNCHPQRSQVELMSWKEVYDVEGIIFC